MLAGNPSEWNKWVNIVLGFLLYVIKINVYLHNFIADKIRIMKLTFKFILINDNIFKTIL